jgi:hypothetical protein
MAKHLTVKVIEAKSSGDLQICINNFLRDQRLTMEDVYQIDKSVKPSTGEGLIYTVIIWYVE